MKFVVKNSLILAALILSVGCSANLSRPSCGHCGARDSYAANQGCGGCCCHSCADESARAGMAIGTSGNKKVAAKRPVVKKEPDFFGKIARASMQVKPVPQPKPEVRALQEALNSRGAKLEADGFMGQKTVLVLRAFQTMNSLPVTGKADAATKKALGLEETVIVEAK